jgi:hypothetical protein
MRLKTLLFLFITAAGFLKAQNFTVSSSQPPKCYGECNGSITFTTSAVSGPFTANVVNSGACPNSTVQNSTNNSITISSVCACAAVYTVSIYTGSIVVGTEIFQFPVYATSSLIIAVNNISAETCSACCNGAANISYSGGNVQGTPTFSIDGVPVVNVTPLINQCSGNHTICMTDASNCIACKGFNVPLLSGLHENTSDFPVSLFPNPAHDALFVESTPDNPISKAEIFDLTGRKISESLSKSKYETTLKLDIKALPGGLYYLYVFNADGFLMQHKKFVKND